MVASLSEQFSEQDNSFRATECNAFVKRDEVTEGTSPSIDFSPSVSNKTSVFLLKLLNILDDGIHIQFVHGIKRNGHLKSMLKNLYENSFHRNLNWN